MSKAPLVLGETETYYHNQVKGKPYKHETFMKMVSLLKKNNPLFHKISRVVSESLVKLGFIVTYEPNDIIYKEGAPIRNIGIILWGQVLYKKKRTKLKFSGYAGSGLG